MLPTNLPLYHSPPPLPRGTNAIYVWRERKERKKNTLHVTSALPALVSQHKSQGGSGVVEEEGSSTPTIPHAYILPTCVNKYFLEGVVHFMRVRSFARHGLRVIWPICQYKSLGFSARRTSPLALSISIIAG